MYDTCMWWIFSPCSCSSVFHKLVVILIIATVHLDIQAPCLCVCIHIISHLMWSSSVATYMYMYICTCTSQCVYGVNCPWPTCTCTIYMYASILQCTRIFDTLAMAHADIHVIYLQHPLNYTPWDHVMENTLVLTYCLPYETDFRDIRTPHLHDILLLTKCVIEASFQLNGFYI